MLLLTLLIIFFAAGIYLSFLNKPYWYVRVFDFPLLEEVIGLIICNVLLLLITEDLGAWDVVLLVISGLAVLLALLKLFQYIPGVVSASLAPEYDDPARQVSIFSANVRQKNRNIQQFRRVADDAHADIMVLYETDVWWAEQTAYLKADYPYHILIPQDNTYGMLLYSRLPLKDHTVNNLCLKGIPSIHAVVELRNTACFELYCIHPKPPQLRQSTSARDSEIVRVAQKVRKTKTPTIVVGDFNDVPWSKSLNLFKRMSNTIDPRRGRGLYNTYNALIPFFRYPLDFIQFNSEFRVIDFHKEEKIGSDHFPLYIRLSFEPENENPDNGYEMNGQAEKDAEEIIAQEKRSIFPEINLWKD